jgi:Fe-S-cluster containining protein
MADDQTNAQQDLAAGRFSSWIVAFGRAQRDDAGAAVPCGGCTACCTSSQFVHVAPDETRTLSRIPSALLFPAPGLPTGNVLMGYDERGHCPMFVDGGCSIYEDRPRTCRTYDCRVFPATGIELDDASKALISDRTRRWKFDLPAERDRRQQAAVRAAAAYLREHADELGDGVLARNPTQLAFVAVAVHGLFLGDGGTSAEPSVDVVAAAVRRAR